MVLLYGFSLLYVLSGIFAYSLNVIHVGVIATTCFLVDRFVFKSVRRFFTIMATVLTMFCIGIYLLYRYDQLETVWLQFLDFITVYYYSVRVTTVYIGNFHQAVALILIGLLIFGPLDYLMTRHRERYPYLISGTVALVLVGFLSKNMGSIKDREAFLILSMTLIIYYFYSFYNKHRNPWHKFGHLSVTILLFLMVIVVGSRVLYTIDPRPLTQEKKGTGFILSDNVEMAVEELDKLNYFRDDVFEIADSFEFDYIEILKLESEEIDYLKAETFEDYSGGIWTKMQDMSFIDDAGVHLSEQVDPANYNAYYTVEQVRTVISNFNSNVVLMNGYGVIDEAFPGNIRVMNDLRRGTYYSNEMLDTGYEYNYQAVIPRYGAKVLDDLIRANSSRPYPRELDALRVLPSDRYSQIEKLAVSVTEGIDNPYDQAMAIESYLRSNYTYTESPPVPPENVDPTLYFLFESREGFCQQFATAQVLMLRSLGIPSRYVAGFYVGSRDIPEDDYLRQIQEMADLDEGVYRVYDANAHTWTEAYFPEVGWIMFESTPVRSYRIEETENTRSSEQEELQDKAPDAFVTLDARYAWGIGGILLLAGLMFVIWLVIRMRRRLKDKTATEKMLDIHWMLRHYLRLLGIRKGNTDTPREFADKVDDLLVDNDALFMVDLMNDYEKVVYGEESLEPEELDKHILFYKHMRYYSAKKLNRPQRFVMAAIGYGKINIGRHQRS